MLKLFFRIVPLFGTFSILFQVLCGVMYNVIGNVYFVKYLVDTVEKIAKAPDLTGPHLFTAHLVLLAIYAKLPFPIRSHFVLFLLAFSLFL